MSRRLLDALPLHHIDTSILMEPDTTEDGRACRKYLQRVGQKYRGQLSLPVLGELMLALLKPISYNDRHDFIEWLSERRVRWGARASVPDLANRPLTRGASSENEVVLIQVKRGHERVSISFSPKTVKVKRLLGYRKKGKWVFEPVKQRGHVCE